MLRLADKASNCRRPANSALGVTYGASARQRLVTVLQSSKLVRRGLVACLAFLSVTTVFGGLGLLSGLVAPPVEMLHGSVFQSFVVPGLALLVIVGGTATLALVLVLRGHRFAWPAVVAASAAIVVFEVVEIAVIGSPPGPSRVMQIFYVCLGVVSAALAARHRTNPGNAG